MRNVMKLEKTQFIKSLPMDYLWQQEDHKVIWNELDKKFLEHTAQR